MLFFFNRLTLGLKQQYFVKILGIAVFVTYVAVFLTITLACYPTHRNWQVDPYPGLVCTFKPQNFYVSTVLNVITDAASAVYTTPADVDTSSPFEEEDSAIFAIVFWESSSSPRPSSE